MSKEDQNRRVFLLIKHCLKGKEKAFKEFYDLLSPALYPICLRYGKNEQNAIDFLQDGFIKIFEKLHNFKHEGSLEGWCKRVLVNEILASYRKKGLQFIDQDATHYSIEPSYREDHMEVQDLIKVLNELPEGYRLVFNLYAVEGFSHKEISEKLSISEGTSKSQLARARKHIQLKLKNEEEIALKNG